MSRMHPSHMSNPFAHLNPQHSIPSSSAYQPQSISGGFNPQHGFGAGALNGGISPFPTTSYGANAFAPGAGGSVFNGASLPGQGQGQGLASVAAQQGFARGAAMQEHTAHQLEAATMDSKSGAQGRIRQVWRHNLEQEMAVLRQLVLKYPYVSMVRFVGFLGHASLGLQVLGCRVPRDSRATHRKLRRQQSRVPLPDASLQRRSAQTNTTRNHSVDGGRRSASTTT